GYAAMTVLLRRLFGDRIADELRAPFILGNSAVFRSLFEEAGLPGVEIRTSRGTARFASIESWVRTDVKGLTLADLLDDAQYRTLLSEAERDLKIYVQRDGTVAFDAPAHIATATKS